MGEKLLKYYQYIYKVKNVSGRMALAQKTNMPSPRAAEQPDSPENINLFRNAVAEITGEKAPLY
jgi:hypothetical protein